MSHPDVLPRCPIPKILSPLSCQACTVLARLSFVSCPASTTWSTALLTLLSCLCCPVLAVLYRLTCLGWPFRLTCPRFSVLPVLSQISSPSYLSTVVPSRLSCPRCPILAVMFWPSCPLFPILYYPDCLLRLSFPYFTLQLFFPIWQLVSPVLPRNFVQSSPGATIPLFLSCPGLFSISCPG